MCQLVDTVCRGAAAALHGTGCALARHSLGSWYCGQWGDLSWIAIAMPYLRIPFLRTLFVPASCQRLNDQTNPP